MHWPTGSEDLGFFVVSFLELLILFEQWAGHRLLSEKVTRRRVRANRPILIPSVPVSEETEIRHFCQFISSVVRWYWQVPALWSWFSYVQVKASWVGISVLMVLSQDHWNPVIISALRLFVGFWGIPKDQLRSFWMALLNSGAVPLFSPRVIPHGLYPGLGMVV